MVYSVFLSHNTTDREWVEQIEQKLWREGIRPYLFEYNPQPGEPVSEKIENAIGKSDAFVVLVTEEGQFSKWLNAEIGYAKAADIPIIPLVDERINNPELPFIGGTEYIRINPKNIGDALPVLVKDLSKRKVKKHLFWGVLAVGFSYLFVHDKLVKKKSESSKHGIDLDNQHRTD